MDLVLSSALTQNSQPLTVTPDYLLFSAGRNLVTLSVDSQQKIYPGHTKLIVCSTASANCKLLASAQAQAIVIWDQSTGESTSFNVAGTPKMLQFTPDSEFLGVLLDSGEFSLYTLKGVQVGKFQAKSATFIELYALSTARRADFFCVQADENRLIHHHFQFDRAQLQYRMSTDYILVPFTGTIRQFTCCCVSYPYAYFGTPNGEIAVFNIEKHTFRTLLKYFKSQVVSIVVLNQQCLAAASFDGDVITLHGQDIEFLVESETAVDANILTCQYAAPDQLIALTQNGTIIQFLMETKQEKSFRLPADDAVELNKHGNQGQLPGQNGYSSSLPHHRKFKKDSVETGDVESNVFAINAESLQILHAFPQKPLLKNDLLHLDSGEIVIGGTENGLVQAWQNGCLLAQMKFRGPCQALRCYLNLIFCCFDEKIYRIQYTGEKFEIDYEIPAPKTCSIAVNGKYFAAGGIDGRVFVFDVETGNNFQRFTEFSCLVEDMLFDNVIDAILHVSVKDGYLVAYDVVKGKKLKSRSLGPNARAFDIKQVENQRHELVAACIDNTVKFFDFDVQDAVQVAELPPQCVNKGKMYLGLEGSRLVAGGCYMDGDEVLALMRQGEDDWEAVDCQLTQGVAVIGVLVGAEQVYVLGDSGEIVVYAW